MARVMQSGLATILVLTVALLASCGGGGGTASPSPHWDDSYARDPYYRDDYYRPISVVSPVDVGVVRTPRYVDDNYLQTRTLTTFGLHERELTEFGNGWLRQYGGLHHNLLPGSAVIDGASYMISAGDISTEEPEEGSGPVYVYAPIDGQAYLVYGIQGLQSGDAITSVEVDGEWTFKALDAQDALRIGVSRYSTNNGFTGYSLSGALVRPDTWKMRSYPGSIGSYDSAAYVVIVIGGGNEARIDSVSVTVGELGEGADLMIGNVRSVSSWNN